MRKGMRNNEIAMVIKAIKNGDDAKSVKAMFKDRVTADGIKAGIKQAEDILTAEEEKELDAEERAAKIIADAEERAAAITAAAVGASVPEEPVSNKNGDDAKSVKAMFKDKVTAEE